MGDSRHRTDSLYSQARRGGVHRGVGGGTQGRPGVTTRQRAVAGDCGQEPFWWFLREGAGEAGCAGLGRLP